MILRKLVRKRVTHTSHIQLLDNVVHKPRHGRLSGQVSPPQIGRHGTTIFTSLSSKSFLCKRISDLRSRKVGLINQSSSERAFACFCCSVFVILHFAQIFSE